MRSEKLTSNLNVECTVGLITSSIREYIGHCSETDKESIQGPVVTGTGHPSIGVGCGGCLPICNARVGVQIGS